MIISNQPVFKGTVAEQISLTFGGLSAKMTDLVCCYKDQETALEALRSKMLPEKWKIWH